MIPFEDRIEIIRSCKYVDLAVPQYDMDKLNEAIFFPVVDGIVGGEVLTDLLKKYNSLPIQVTASFWFLICSFLQKGISVLTTPIFTRLLTTTEYGRFNIFNSWLGILTIFVTMNLYQGVYTQGLIKFDREQNIFSSSLQGLTVVLVSAWTVMYLLFRNFWNELFSLTTLQMLAMILMIWATAVFSFWASEQRVRLSYKRLVAVTLAVSVAKPALSIILVLHSDDKVTARILGLAFVELTGYIGLFIAQMKRGKKFYYGKFWKYAILYNLPLIPHYLSQTVLSSSDRIMIGNLVGEGAAGIYSLAYALSMIMTLFNSALSHTMGPWIYQKIRDKRSGDIAEVGYVALVIVAAVNILLIAFAPEIVAVFAPDSYYDAIWVIPPVAMSVYFIFAYDLFAKFQFYFEKTSFVMLASIIAASLNVSLNYIFIKLCGYYAAGYTTLVCYIVSTAGHYLFMRKICREYMEGTKVYDLRILIIITVSFITAGFSFLGLYNNVVLRYVLIIIICLVVFFKRGKLLTAVKKFL